MRLYKRNGVYQVTYQSAGGKQTRRSLKTREKRIAEQRAAKLELTLHEAKLFGKEPPHSFKELMMHYLEAKQTSRGFARLQCACKPLLEYFADRNITQLNESHVEQYAVWRSQTVSSGTVRREIGVLSAAFNHAIKKRHWRIENPCVGADKPQDPKGRVRFLTRAEAQKLIQAAHAPIDKQGNRLPDQDRSPVLRDFIELTLNTGCRKGELLNLKWSNVDFSTRLLYLEQTKSGEWQTVPVTEEARVVLLRRLRLREATCPETQFVFFHQADRAGAIVGDRVKDVRTSFVRACKQAGIEDFRIHDLRHTYASWLVMGGVSLYDVSKLLRHSSIKMTERYAHIAPEYLHNTVANHGFSAHFQHTEIPIKLVGGKNGLNT